MQSAELIEGTIVLEGSASTWSYGKGRAVPVATLPVLPMSRNPTPGQPPLRMDQLAEDALGCPLPLQSHEKYRTWQKEQPGPAPPNATC